MQRGHLVDIEMDRARNVLLLDFLQRITPGRGMPCRLDDLKIGGTNHLGPHSQADAEAVSVARLKTSS